MVDETIDSETGFARQALAGLRMQEYGNANPARVLDPIVEPLWSGIRLLVAVGDGEVAMVDIDGDPVGGFDEIEKALALAVPSGDVVVEGYITKQASHQARAVVAWSDEMPSMGAMIGLRRNRTLDATKLKEETLAAATFEPDDLLSFIATDLLWIDETGLLDVPLLERRRLLEAVVIESDGVRLGAFVRPPIERWVASWRAQGFGGLTYKAANSRYRPGEPNPDWVIAGMPRR
jgi:hypothetical protein